MACHIIFLPLSNERHEVVVSEFLVKDLGEEVEVANEGSLENDWDVRCVE